MKQKSAVGVEQVNSRTNAPIAVLFMKVHFVLIVASKQELNHMSVPHAAIFFSHLLVLVVDILLHVKIMLPRRT